MTLTSAITFDDGAVYEDFMGVWSGLVGSRFLDWLGPPPGARWCDVGCGNGAFSELLLGQAAAAAVEGIDPSPEQIEFARQRLAGRPARFEVGDATGLPYADAAFDAAVMALVIFFVPDPAKGVAEMARVVRPGGSVAAYAWDMFGAGFPYSAFMEEMAALGVPSLLPPSAEASRLDVMRSLWEGAGLVDVDTCVIAVQRPFESFDAFWGTARNGPRIAPRLAEMSSRQTETLKERVQARLPADGAGRLTCRATANAVRGRVRPAASDR